MYDVGDLARLTFSLTDVAGAPANGTVVLTVTKPDDSTVTPTVANPATGSYTADVSLDQAGRWTYRWVSTGAVVASQSDVLNVSPAAPIAIISLAEAKAHLNKSGSVNIDDEELRSLIASASTFIEKRIGAVARRTIVETVTPQSGRIFLSSPIISVTDISSAYGYSATYSVGNWTVDDRSLVPNYGTWVYGWPVTVTYVGGRTVVPEDIIEAAKDYVKWRWDRTQLGPANPVDLATGAEFPVSVPATVPYEILNKLEPYMSPAVA